MSANADSILRAAHYATKMHGDQKRKYTGEPYVCHCFDVAHVVANFTDNPDTIVAAILHDTVEDTSASIVQISRLFGDPVGELVGWLTDVSKPEDGNRAEQKRLDREHIAKAPAAAKLIKLADLLSNTSTIVQHDPSFAKVYLREKELLLPHLEEGNFTLWRHAKRELERGLRLLGHAE